MSIVKLFKKSKPSNMLWYFISFLITTLLFVGGLGVRKEMIQIIGLFLALLLVIAALLIKRKILLPPSFSLFTLFTGTLLANLLWSKDSKSTLEYMALFLGGGLFWLAFYNLKKEFAPLFDKLIILLGLVFGGLFIFKAYQVGGPIFNPSFKLYQVKPWSLYLPYSAYLNHNNIGDLWSVALTIIVFHLLKKPKNIFYWTFALLGTYFLAVSLSRAAYVALAVGVIYLAKAKGWLAKYQKIFIAFLLAVATLFLFAASQKTTLFSRQYYVQGILGLMHNPWGVGIGNFGIISKDPANHLFGLTHFSSNAHNIVLEVLAGMGILGVSFIIWLIKILIDLWNEKDSKNLVYRAVFFALFANFFFHSSYLIPTMLWLWFMVLGLAQDRIRSR